MRLPRAVWITFEPQGRIESLYTSLRAAKRGVPIGGQVVKYEAVEHTAMAYSRSEYVNKVQQHLTSALRHYFLLKLLLHSKMQDVVAQHWQRELETQLNELDADILHPVTFKRKALAWRRIVTETLANDLPKRWAVQHYADTFGLSKRNVQTLLRNETLWTTNEFLASVEQRTSVRLILEKA